MAGAAFGEATEAVIKSTNRGIAKTRSCPGHPVVAPAPGVGDYFTGPSHVLPTGGTARFANGLCANDFLKRSSVIQYNHDALEEAAEDIRRLAAVEGLTAHSASVDVRLEDE